VIVRPGGVADVAALAELRNIIVREEYHGRGVAAEGGPALVERAVAR
jgi:hypothetical protein